MNKTVQAFLENQRGWTCVEGRPRRDYTTHWRTVDGRKVRVHFLKYRRGRTVTTKYIREFLRTDADLPIVYIHHRAQRFTPVITSILDRAPNHRVWYDGSLVPRILNPERWEVVDPSEIPCDIPRSMQYRDAVAHYFGCGPGNVLRYTGPSETAGRTVRYYRVIASSR